MSPLGAHTAALRASSVENSREKFFRLLFHDDRNSFYVISTDASGAWADTALRADALSSYHFDMVHNYYITHNGFTGKRRLSTRTRQLNALFFDLDCHDASPTECDRLINAILERLHHAVQTVRLPKPTMIVDSGRGVHLYYVLDRSIPYRFKGTGEVNEPGISFFNHVQGQLADLLVELFEDIEKVKVDRSVFDASRVSRIPNTYNLKAKRQSRLVAADEVYHSLSDLNGFKPIAPSRSADATPRKKLGKRAVIMKYDRLLISRLNKVAELQEHRKFDCEGNRELMCFVYYNTAVQVYNKEDAWGSLLSFNARFNKPISLSELEGIRNSVSSVRNVKGEAGYYVLSASKVVDLLALTEEEIEATHFFASKRMVERMEAKRKTKEKRVARDERIVSLYKKGTMTHQQVALEVGCSARTVYAVLKKAGIANSRSIAEKRRLGTVVTLKDAARAALDRVSREVSVATSGLSSFSSGFRNFMANVSLSSARGGLLSFSGAHNGSCLTGFGALSPIFAFEYGPRVLRSLLYYPFVPVVESAFLGSGPSGFYDCG